jgi:hypothetical protein
MIDIILWILTMIGMVFIIFVFLEAVKPNK